MDYDEVEALRRTSAAWRLLRAKNAPLVIGFLGRVFVEDNVRGIAAADLVARLDDELYSLNGRLGEETFPRPAKEYLDEWASPDYGWLRKYYPPGADEPHFDATTAVEKALAWLQSLQTRSFVGTESRLTTMFDLLRQLVFGAESDPDVRLVELERQRGALDREIERVRSGQVELMDTSAQRDRYQQFARTAIELLADFREVENNFRTLDRELRERITGWTGSKGELLEDVLGSRNGISDSDQGKSFHAFYDFLLSPQRQAEFSELLQRVHALEAVGQVDPRMRQIHYDWLDAGERTQTTVRLLSEQLRRFLDDQVFLENRRVLDLVKGIEATSLRLREQPAMAVGAEVDAVAPTVNLPMERPLYTPQAKQQVDSSNVDDEVAELDAAALFEQVYVDPEPLRGGVRRALRGRRQVGLAELLQTRPIEQGLAELVTYLSLSDSGFTVVYDEEVREELGWHDPAGQERTVSLPRVTFARTEES
ncbi:DUF3375 domain-containing protein [Kribbella catacumbae]|uniref:DUF3375 domain-containing protein n=1 Tax=Kribbella catacumbae TaxID=460086 RepID=UPI00036B8445|nr:DUF3375 domain-containing protein [Kribbella catacumbae]